MGGLQNAYWRKCGVRHTLISVPEAALLIGHAYVVLNDADLVLTTRRSSSLFESDLNGAATLSLKKGENYTYPDGVGPFYLSTPPYLTRPVNDEIAFLQLLRESMWASRRFLTSDPVTKEEQDTKELLLNLFGELTVIERSGSITYNIQHADVPDDFRSGMLSIMDSTDTLFKLDEIMKSALLIGKIPIIRVDSEHTWVLDEISLASTWKFGTAILPGSGVTLIVTDQGLAPLFTVISTLDDTWSVELKDNGVAVAVSYDDVNPVKLASKLSSLV